MNNTQIAETRRFTETTLGTALASAQGLLFDMDGVLIDSEPLHQHTLVELSAGFGRRFEKEEAETFKGANDAYTGRRIRELFPHITHTAEELAAIRMKMYWESFHKVTPVEGAREFVAQSRAAGFLIALATSSPPDAQQRAFTRFHLSEFFDSVVTGSDVRNSKPHPEPYQRAAAGLGLRPGECLVIEDSLNGVLSGKAAGCQVVGITTSFSDAALRKTGADFVIRSFSELSAIYNKE